LNLPVGRSYRIAALPNRPADRMADSNLPSDADLRAEYSETERQIFDAALRVFARKGRAGARMQEIADAADINKAMLHYYFRNKETLYGEVFAFTMRRFMASFGASLKEAPTFAETLRVFIDGYVEFVRTNQDAMRLMVNENLAGGTHLGEHLKRLKASGDAPPQIFIEKVEAAVESGEIRAVDPDHTLVSVISTCIFFFVMRPTVQTIHAEAASDWGEFVEARKDHLFDLLYHGLAPDADA
jgi:TetR/AcrR family transcriptional regulator